MWIQRGWEGERRNIPIPWAGWMQAWLLRSRTSGMEGLVLHPILLRQLLPSHLICLALALLAPNCWIIGINWLPSTLAESSAQNLPVWPDYQPQFGASYSFIILWQHLPGTGKGKLN